MGGDVAGAPYTVETMAADCLAVLDAAGADVVDVVGISMGGTIIRLVEQGHKVHIAYMTSGNIAVFDHDARRFIDFVEEFLAEFGEVGEQ